MNLKKDFKTSALIILLVITAIALLDNARTSDSAAELKENRDELAEKVERLEKEIEKRAKTTDELKRDNDRLTINLSDLEKEVATAQPRFHIKTSWMRSMSSKPIKHREILKR